jgi:hypothetical protein
MTSIWSFIDGTFSGTKPERLYFSQDYPNLIEYGLLCPAYVGLSVRFFILVVYAWKRLSRPSGLVVTTAPRLPRASIGCGIWAVLSITAVFTIIFIRDVLNPAKFPMVGWWVERVVDGSRVLSPLGIYYVLMNFTLQSICVMAALVFVIFFFLSIEFGRVVAQQPVTNAISFEAFCRLLPEFTQAYVTLKLLAVALVLNFESWEYEMPRGSVAAFVFNAVMVVFGVFLISGPRYYIELKWFRFRVRRALHNRTPDNHERDDIRPYYARVIAWAADSLILSDFLFKTLHLSI